MPVVSKNSRPRIDKEVNSERPRMGGNKTEASLCNKLAVKLSTRMYTIKTDTDVWDMKRDGIPVLRGKQSKFIFIQMKERVNQNGFKVQNIAVNERGGLL